MACTTILVGKNASYNGSTLISRSEDCPSGQFCTKKIRTCACRKSARKI